MLTASIVLLTTTLALTLATLVAFAKAAAIGQFDRPKEGSKAIFDSDEPVGLPTDPNLPNKHHD